MLVFQITKEGFFFFYNIFVVIKC